MVFGLNGLVDRPGRRSFDVDVRRQEAEQQGDDDGKGSAKHTVVLRATCTPMKDSLDNIDQSYLYQ